MQGYVYNKEINSRFNANMFGNALKEKRTIFNDHTHRDLAKILGVTHSTISRIERGLTCELAVILVVCDWLERSICDFITTEPRPIIFQSNIAPNKKSKK